MGIPDLNNPFAHLPHLVHHSLMVKKRDLEDLKFLMHMLAADAEFAQSPADMAQHPAFLEIMKLGDRLITMIFAEIKNGDRCWVFTYHCYCTGAVLPTGYMAYAFVLNQAFSRWAHMENSQPLKRSVCVNQISL